MRRVAGVSPLNIRPVTFVVAVIVAAVCVVAALYVADRSVSSNQQTPSRTAKTSPEPSQSVNRAKKAARETGKAGKQSARLAPGVLEPKQDETEAEAGAPPETGRASWYALDSATASGEPMDADALTAAHRSLPFGTNVRVENLDNGRVVVVRINDRGPFAKDRIIDLSKAAAKRIDMIEDGVATVRVSPVGDLVASNKQTSGQAAPLDR